MATASGKTIETTGSHPYLVLNESEDFSRKEKTPQSEDSSVTVSNLVNRILPAELTFSVSAQNILSSLSVDNSIWSGRDLNPHYSTGKTNSLPINLPPRSVDALYHSEIQNATWLKVIYLKPGMQIAVADTDNSNYGSSTSIGWDEIVSIEPTGEKQVYDLSIEGMHNFVANGIVAHNTYLDGNITGTGLATFANSTTTLSTITTLWPTDVYGFTLQGAIAANSQNITGISALKGGYESFL